MFYNLLQISPPKLAGVVIGIVLHQQIKLGRTGMLTACIPTQEHSVTLQVFVPVQRFRTFQLLNLTLSTPLFKIKLCILLAVHIKLTILSVMG